MRTDRKLVCVDNSKHTVIAALNTLCPYCGAVMIVEQAPLTNAQIKKQNYFKKRLDKLIKNK